MKLLPFYKDKLHCKTADEVFDFLLANLKARSILSSYFVNWEKVFAETGQSGKEDFDRQFRDLLNKHPGVVQVIPALVVRDGARTKKHRIIMGYANNEPVYEDFALAEGGITAADIEKYLIFVKESGLKDLLVNMQIKGYVDNVIAVEAGLDSNARQHRGGHAMQDVVEAYIKNSCEQSGSRYLKGANADQIKQELGHAVSFAKASRRYDFVIDNGKELFLIETNFYGGGGSKLKAAAAEYAALYNELNGAYKFIWITDGYGWKATEAPLRGTFDRNDYVFSLAMLEKGILDFLIASKNSAY